MLSINLEFKKIKDSIKKIKYSEATGIEVKETGTANLLLLKNLIKNT